MLGRTARFQSRRAALLPSAQTRLLVVGQTTLRLGSHCYQVIVEILVGSIGHQGVYAKDANVYVVVTNEPAVCYAFTVASGVCVGIFIELVRTDTITASAG